MASYVFMRIELDSFHSFNTSTPVVTFAMDTNPYVATYSITASGRIASCNVGFGGVISPGNHTFKIKIDPSNVNGFLAPGNQMGLVSYLTNSASSTRVDVSGVIVKIDYTSIVGASYIGGEGTINVL